MARLLVRWRLAAACVAALLLAATPPQPPAYDLFGTEWTFSDAVVSVGGTAHWFNKTLHMKIKVPGSGHLALGDDGHWDFVKPPGPPPIMSGPWGALTKSGKVATMVLDAAGAQQLEGWLHELVYDLTSQYATIVIDATFDTVVKHKVSAKLKVDKKNGVVRLFGKASFTLTGTSDAGDHEAPCKVKYKLHGLSLALPLSAVTP
jgi:hypothetical protein